MFLINKNKFISTTIRDVKIPKTFEVLYANESNTYHYIHYNGTEGIMLIWDEDVFDINKTVYIRNLK